ncbi:gamma-glutamyl-gamma-aminobutyrate hydrolase family protein [soil metagenome]
MERSHGLFYLYGIANTYTTAVEAAGGIPLVIPPQEGNVDQLAGHVDGFLITGGGDVDPARYGDDQVHPETYGVHAGRDALEFGLVRAAIDMEIPTLCICRGIQVLNVVLGGTLYQDIADQYSRELQHQQQRDDIAKEDPGHTVDVEPESLLATVYESTAIAVNSFHHQGIKEIGEGLRAAATASDGIVEGLELPDHPWLLGVQWHPEMMFTVHTEHLKPFQGLVKAAASRVAVPA